MPKQPQDRKPKADASVYTFEHDGKTYRLPNAADGVPLLRGKFLRDAFMDGEEGQLRLGFAMLEAIPDTEAARDALYAMPAPDMLAHVQAWMDASKNASGGASLGESSSSSD